VLVAKGCLSRALGWRVFAGSPVVGDALSIAPEVVHFVATHAIDWGFTWHFELLREAKEFAKPHFGELST